MGGYPKEIGEIILTKCATSGCHNDASYAAAGGLNLTTWDNLFKGGTSGAAVIPYRPDFSTFCYYTNVDSNLGVTLTPTMPEGGQPLSKQEYITLANWIARGAPNENSKIAFAENPDRNKMYVANRLCDVVTVVDRSTFLQMRYVDIGTKTGVPDLAESIVVSPDKRHWYVSFFTTSNVVQQFDANNDTHTKDVILGTGNWLSFVITNDSKYGYFADNNNPGKIVCADLKNNVIVNSSDFDGQLHYPLGMAINESMNKIYCGTSSGNFIYAIDITDPKHPSLKQHVIDGSNSILYNSTLDPVALETGNNNICFIACQKTKEIRIMDMNTDKLRGVIQLPDAPKAMAYSHKHEKLFVVCPDDSFTFPGNRGSIVVINAKTMTVMKNIKSGYEPYSIAIDDETGIAIIANANLHTGGPTPHHTSKCGGRNGNIVFLDINTLELVSGKKSEVAVFPFSTGCR